MARKENLTPLMKKFEEETGKHAKWGGEPTKAYKKWCREQMEEEIGSKKTEDSPEKSKDELSEWFSSFQKKTGELIPEGQVKAKTGLPEPISEGIMPPEAVEIRKRAEIIDIEGETEPLYKIKLPELSNREEELVEEVKNRAIDEIDIDPSTIADPDEREKVFTREVKKMIKKKSRGISLSSGRLDELAGIVVQEMIGYGPLDPLLDDPSLEDILVTGLNEPVYVFHRERGMCKTNIRFEDEEHLINHIERMARLVGRRIDQQTPLLDARLPDGSRVNATIPPVSLDGPTISIRKFRADPFTIINLIEYGTMTTDVAGFLWLIVDGLGVKPANILYAGGTACGKTTTMNAVTAFAPSTDRIVSIEDTAELQLPHEHWVRLETRPPNVEGRGEITMEDLTKNALRMRPDRIIVGEVRGPEAMTMFTGMNTGHDGCSGTVHSNSAMETITRLSEPPMNVPKIMIPALDAVIMEQRIHHRKKGQIRRITEIAEVTGFEGEKPQLSRIYKWNAKNDLLEPTGVPSEIKKTIADFTGLDGRDIEIEVERRAAVIEWMRQAGIRDIYKVGETIQEYYHDPERVLERVQSDIPDFKA